jgi:hypothetical protein
MSRASDFFIFIGEDTAEPVNSIGWWQYAYLSELTKSVSSFTTG